jgi:murein DD-endopeptidase / murein LD-carboxypeptidase
MLNIFTLFLIVLTFLLSFSTSAKVKQDFLNSSSSLEALILSSSDHNDRQKLEKILTHYGQWEGVSYKLGGNTRKGIDCSAYMQRVFEDEFSLSLPRSSHEQMKQGSQITKSDLHAGDLVFFKTSQQMHHVGVYIGEGNFIHASSSMGVTISNLDNKYWGARYTQARRINGVEA